MTKTIQVIVKFFSENNGGRSSLPSDLLSTYKYRPHFVVGDPHQKKAIVDNKNQSMEDYLGIVFVKQEEELIAEKEIKAEIQTLYPSVDYSALVDGATFTIREGESIVGSGKVIKNSL